MSSSQLQLTNHAHWSDRKRDWEAGTNQASMPHDEHLCTFFEKVGDKDRLVQEVQDVSFGYIFEPQLPLGKLHTKLHVFSIAALQEVKKLSKGNPDHFLGYLRGRLKNQRGLIVKLIHGKDGSIDKILTNLGDNSYIMVGAIAAVFFTNRFPRDLKPWNGDELYESSIRSGFELIHLPKAKLIAIDDEDYNSIIGQFDKAMTQIADEMRNSTKTTLSAGFELV